MKNSFLIFLLLLLCISCDDKKPEESQQAKSQTEDHERFPDALHKVFEAHGGLETWRAMNNLCFEMEKPDGVEVHSTDLNSRKSLIEGENFTIGFDGKNVWKEDPENTFKGNARFYHNLMFYFYAMPFIISDPGAFYTERKDTTLLRKNYGVIHIGFGRNVGDAPDDEYIIFYDKETHKMEWLGYTVTYFEGDKNKDWHYIKYDTWLEEGGLLLPQTMVWYEAENNKPLKPTRRVSFSKVVVSESVLPDSLFNAPDNAEFVD
jgi:hypothetical protein